ncbi:MAG: amidohydrolase family protein [Dehalococcoidia bacterium]
MIALKNGNLLMSDGKLVKGDMLIEGGTIKAVGERAAIPPKTKVIDASGKTVMPGLIDAHTHLTVYQDPALLSAAGAGKAIMRGAFLARQALRAGITTMRDMGGFCFTDIDLRNAIAAGQVPGPRLLCSGKVISTTGGHIYYVSREADGPDEVRKAAREQLKAGADLIKVMCSGGVERVDESINAVQLNMDEIRAAVGVAQDNGTVVAAHAHPKRAMKEALLAGVNSIEHGSLLDDEVAEIMLKKKAFIVPTFSVYASIANLGLPGLSDRAKFVYEAKRKSFKIVLRRGVRWGVGTDSGAFSPMSSIVDEMIITHSLGVSAAEALRRVTSVNAELIGLKDTGTLAAGKRADIIIVDGNPLKDLEAMRKVSITVVNGVVYDWSAVP